MSNKLAVEIDPLREEEAKVVKGYLGVLQGGEHADVVSLGMEFLRRWPDAILSDHVRMQVAFALKKGEARQSLHMYNSVCTSTVAPDWLKQEANWEAAHLLFGMGDIAGAVKKMENVGTDEAKWFLKKWKDMNRAQEQK